MVMVPSLTPMKTKAGVEIGVACVMRSMMPRCVSGRYPQKSTANSKVLAAAYAMYATLYIDPCE